MKLKLIVCTFFMLVVFGCGQKNIYVNGKKLPNHIYSLTCTKTKLTVDFSINEYIQKKNKQIIEEYHELYDTFKLSKKTIMLANHLVIYNPNNVYYNVYEEYEITNDGEVIKFSNPIINCRLTQVAVDRKMVINVKGGHKYRIIVKDVDGEVLLVFGDVFYLNT